MALLRVKLARGQAVRWLTPREFLHVLQKAAEDADLPVARTKGPHARLRITPGPPLRAGYLSRSEYVDFELAAPIAAGEFGRRLGAALPEGIDVLWQRRLPQRSRSIKAAVQSLTYTIMYKADPQKAAAFERAETWPLKQVRKRGARVLDLKRSISRLEVQSDKVIVRIEMCAEGIPKPEEVLAAIFGIAEGEAMEFPVERTDIRLAPSKNPSAAMEYL